MNRASIDTIDSALRFIPADDRDTWVKVGMAIKSELGDSGYSLWDYWSQSASNYQERAAQLVWRSFKDGRTRSGTLFHIAKENGYKYDREASARHFPEKKPPPPQKNTKKYVAEIWLRANCSDDAVRTHPYAIAKGIDWAAGAGRVTANGRVIGKEADCIAVPIRNIETNKVVGVQCINCEGAKQTFGSLSGRGLLLGNTLDKRLDWFVAEGWASAYSVVFHHCQGNACCAAAFGKSNLNAVAHEIANVYRPDRLVIIKERDA